jgi:hypothetical protein
METPVVLAALLDQTRVGRAPPPEEEGEVVAEEELE